MPTQRYLTIQVGGNSTIYSIGITGSNNTDRKVFVTDGTALVGTMSFGGDQLMEHTINYTVRLQHFTFFVNAASNLYYLSATNVVVSSVKEILSDKGVSFNGSEILNANNLSLEVYNVLGKKVFESKENISIAPFQKGIYFVRAVGVNDVLKFNK
jgi:hypothetical protein